MADDLVKALAKVRGPLSGAPIERSKYLAEALAKMRDNPPVIQSYPELGARLAAQGLTEWKRGRLEKQGAEAQAKEQADFAKLMGQILGGNQPPVTAGAAPGAPPSNMDDALASYAKFPSAVDQVRSPTNPNAMSMFGAGGQPQPQAAQPSAAQQPPQPQAPPNPRVAQIQALLSLPYPLAQAMGMKMAEQLMNPEMTVVNTSRGPMRVAQDGPEGQIADIPEDPIYMNTPDGVVEVPRGGGAPRLVYGNTSKNTAGKPSISELRQWGNSYNDDVRAITQNMGNLRNSVPYASAVLANRGNPPPGENWRISDTRLLRAAARADTGPGVLTEGEVFGTLSPSLQQEILKQGAYFDASRVTLTPQDRLALAQNVMNGTRSTANDLWTRYEAAAGQLEEAGVTLKEAGITSPEFPHPEDMAALYSPRGKYEVGREYVGPTGRQYLYGGPGRWKFTQQGQPKPRAGGAAPQDAADNELKTLEEALRQRGIDPSKLP